MMLANHLRDRGLDPQYSPVWIDEKNFVATFPIMHLNGRMAGYQAYRPDASKEKKNDEKSRYYTYMPRGTYAPYGMSTLEWKSTEPIILVEGIFDAVKFQSLGAQCLAALSNNPKPIRAFLKATGKNVVVIADSGAGGASLLKYASRKEWTYVCENGDPGDLSLEETRTLLDWAYYITS